MGKIKAMRIPEGAVVIGEHMYFKTAQNVDLKDLSEMELKKMAIRDNMKAENDAIMMYSKYIDLLPAGDPVRKGLEDIRDEEKEHAGELHQLLVTLDPSELYDFNEGVGEVKREQGVKDAAKKTSSGNPYLFVTTDGSGGLVLELAKDGEYSVVLPTAKVPSNMGYGESIDLDEGVLDEYGIDPNDDEQEIGYAVQDYLEDQRYYDVSASRKAANVKKTALDWKDDSDIIPGSFSADVNDGSEVVVLPPEETGFDGHVVYWSEDSALVDAIGDSLLRPKPFPTADDAKDAAEKWVREKSGSAKTANGWSTDGITCTLEEDNVKLFVEPELDKWRWDVNVDGELFDTGLADSMPEAQICAEDCAEKAIGHSFVAEKEGRYKRLAGDYYDDLREVEEALRDEIEYGARFESEEDVRYFVQDFFQQTGFGYSDEWMDQTDFALENMDIGKYVTGAKRGKHAKRRKKAGLLLDWQDMGGGQYVVKGDLCDGVVFEDGGSWSWRLYDSKWDRFDDTYGYYGDGFGSKEEAMDDIERSLNALKRMFGSSSPKVDEVYNEKWYG